MLYIKANVVESGTSRRETMLPTSLDI